MHNIEMGEITPEFARCWQAAGKHLQRNLLRQDLSVSWLKTRLEPPFLEHLSFRLGNQLFFVRVQDVERRLVVPGNLRGLRTIADGCEGHPCIMPMFGFPSTWEAGHPGWGLLHAVTRDPIDPVSLVSDELIVMTDWEVHDFAVQMVRQQLVDDGRQIMSSQGNPAVNPSLWFVGEQGPEWVVVRAVRYPENEAAPPANWEAIEQSCAGLSRKGHFASVSVASADQSSQAVAGSVVPLRRGGPMHVRYEGLVPRSG
jgi:hypothetical protein